MRKLIAGAAAAGTVALAAAVPSTASASTSCDTGRSPVTYTRGGYAVTLNNYTSVRGMACSSVRYVANQWLRRKIARQYGWPRISGPFYDGYVTWHCRKLTSYRWQCDEYTSNTSFRFTGVVR
jgi:hypothetical protein